MTISGETREGETWEEGHEGDNLLSSFTVTVVFSAVLTAVCFLLDAKCQWSRSCQRWASMLIFQLTVWSSNVSCLVAFTLCGHFIMYTLLVLGAVLLSVIWGIGNIHTGMLPSHSLQLWWLRIHDAALSVPLNPKIGDDLSAVNFCHVASQFNHTVGTLCT